MKTFLDSLLRFRKQDFLFNGFRALILGLAGRFGPRATSVAVDWFSDSERTNKNIALGRNWCLAMIACDITAAIILVGMAAMLVETSQFYPAINPDEAGAYLGLQLLEGTFGFPLDPRGGDFSRYYFLSVYPPVYYLFNAVVFWLFGFGIIQARAVTIFFMIAAAGVSYLTVRRHAGAAAALITLACFLHFVPVRVYPWIVNRPDIAVHFFVVLSIVVMAETWRMSEKGARPWAAIAGFVYGLAVLSHYVALMAGPAMALLLWVHSGRKFWRASGFYYYVLGFFVPVAGFLLVFLPYVKTIFSNLMSYHTGDLSPWLSHLRVLIDNYSQIIFILVPLMGVIVIGAILSPGFARKIRYHGVLWAGMSVAFFILVSFYPNIKLVWFYGLMYIYAAAIGMGYLFSFFFPRQGVLAVLGLIIAFAAIGNRTVNLQRANEGNRDSTGGIPVTAAMDWTRSFENLLSGPAIASISFLFSAAGDRVVDSSNLRNFGNRFAFDEKLYQAIPDFKPIDSFRSLIIDHYRDYYDANHLLAANRSLLRGGEPLDSAAKVQQIGKTVEGLSAFAMKSFVPIGVIRDPGHVTGNFTIFRRREDLEKLPLWPRMAVATPDGAVEQAIEGQCHVARSLDVEFQPVPDAQGLWHFSFPVQFPTGWSGPAMVRLSLQADQGPGPLGFMVYYPSAAHKIKGHRSIIESGTYPFYGTSTRDSLTYVGSQLPTGGRGGDLMILPSETGERGFVSIYTIVPAHLKQLELALLINKGDECKEAGVVGTAGMMDVALADIAIARSKPEEAKKMPDEKDLSL